MKKIIALNWKMNPASVKEAKEILGIVSNSNVIIFPPFIYLGTLLNLKKAKLGAQDTFWENPPAGGAYTGEISPSMLKNMSVKYVIIGHSERRKWQNETDEMINKKMKSALEAGLKVILCVGESIQVRKKGLKSIKDFIKKQIQKDLNKITSYKIKNLVIAYEPIWAIGTGNFCKPEDALEIIKFIKSLLDLRFKIQNSKVLYGGSVNSKNISNFLKHKEIDGVLVGGASVDKKELRLILKNIYVH